MRPISGQTETIIRLVIRNIMELFVEIFGTLKCTTTKATVGNEYAARLMAVACCVGWLQDAHRDILARL
jgi:hypothetical protein